MAKVNKMASKRFEERAESMKSDFSNFMEKQQGSFNKLANRWGLGDLINGDDDEGIHTLREENFVIFVVFVNNHEIKFPQIQKKKKKSMKFIWLNTSA